MNEERTARTAKALLDVEALKVSMDPPFTWTSGIKSPIYCDNRKVISFVEARKVIVEGFKELIAEKGIEFNVIGGTATAAIPWAAFLAYDLQKPMVYIRPAKKEHGAGKQIEGHLEPGQKVLIVEDLISTGGSSVKAAEAVRTEGGCTVDTIMAIVTWELAKSKDALEAADINLHTLTNFTNVIGTARELGKITEEQAGKIMEFSVDPPSWGEKMGF